MSAVPIITIDGPGGSGKGTISRLVAGRLGWHLLDSGALYRLLGLAARDHGVATEDAVGLARLGRQLAVDFGTGADGEPRVLLEGADVTREIRTERSGEAASRVAAVPAAREALLERQRGFGIPPGLVADGRDMGTVVFPDAQLKIFLTASLEERARRRHKQLKEQGLSANLDALFRELARRDERDSQRSVAPLVAAEDAITVDTTGLSIDAVVDEVLGLAIERFDIILDPRGN
jgi:cytidylate kinase